MWKNIWLRAIVLLLSTALSLSALMAESTPQDHPPQLLLTAQRLRRLRRDRDRQTVRWSNFENRVQSVPDSPERGFELALYYAITGDEPRGKEAVRWALAHKCELRQMALILDWCAGLISDDERRSLTTSACVGQANVGVRSLRDELFIRTVRGEDTEQLYTVGWKRALEELERSGFRNAPELYAACEFLDAVRTTQHVDLRQDAPDFFSRLPAEILLGMRPEQVEHPGWQMHVSALALVSLDPNLTSSQYLQGWGMEDRQMIREGPGVAYELLWANPYLPGVSYQNLDPWVYERSGLLLARTGWQPDACWVSISASGVSDENCPAGWQQRPNTFGDLKLAPMAGRCIETPVIHGKEEVIVWKLHPGQRVSYVDDDKQVSSQADAAGLWLFPGRTERKICGLP